LFISAISIDPLLVMHMPIGLLNDAEAPVASMLPRLPVPARNTSLPLLTAEHNSL
jgi:hypothetical protein